MKVKIQLARGWYLRVPMQEVKGKLEPDESVSIKGKWFRVAEANNGTAILKVVPPAEFDPLQWSSNYGWTMELL